MCGRYGFGNPARLGTLPLGEDVAAALADLDARFNVAPSQAVPLVLQDREGRRALAARWGLVPFWADDPTIGNRLANARSDSVAAKPSFRNAFRSRRALMPADLFYEWQAIPGQKAKQPWCIRRPDDEPFAMAALWERWTPKDAPAHGSAAEPLLSCCVITTDANAAMAPIHHRMPVILDAADYDRWLDPATPPAVAESLLRPYEGALRTYRVSTVVNAPRNDAPACAEPWDGD